jgi:hypothetical protein
MGITMVVVIDTGSTEYVSVRVKRHFFVSEPLCAGCEVIFRLKLGV